MEKIIDYNQKSAIKLGTELAQEITTNAKLAEIFLGKIKTISQHQKYADVIKEVLSRHPKINIVSNFTLRSAAQKALKEILSTKEYQEITTKSLQRGGKNSITQLQKAINVNPLSSKEKEILEEIGKNPEGYKKNTVRDNKKIQKELYKETQQERKISTIKAYMSKYKQDKKEYISWKKDPEEINSLKEIYTKYYRCGEKLPSRQIMNELNALHHNNRNENAIENYIRTHRKNDHEKKSMTSQVRSAEEIVFIKNILHNKGSYTALQGKDGYNLEKILYEYKKIFPHGTRTTKGIKHQLERQKKLLPKE